MSEETLKTKIVVICGPTGIGKTGAAIDIARRFEGEIISADSMQIYRHMDIGTAKPTDEERVQVRHHLIDIIDPDQPFDAAAYATRAGQTITALVEKGRLPFIVGGTGLYIKVLIHGMFQGKTSEPTVRKELKATAARRGTRFLHDQLRDVDPAAANRMHPNDTFRIIRALEVFRVTGKAITQLQNQHGFSDRRFDALKIGLDMDRAALYDRIDRRVDTMIENGLAAEVSRLLEVGYPGTLKSMQSIGYRHMVDFITGRRTWEATVEAMKRDTRRYAKRQLTWFRADPEIVWLEPGQKDEMIGEIENFLKE